MQQRKLILIKHAMPVIDEQKSSGEWSLSDAGKAKSEQLAKQLTGVHTKTIYSSYEPKAIETARSIASTFGCTVIQKDHLQEQSRNEVNFMPRGEFIETMMKFFQYPHALIVGEETAYEAKNRFIQAVKGTIQDSPQDEDIVIVAHGTVNTLFVSAFNEIDQYEFWSHLDLPSYIVLDVDSFKLLEVVERIDGTEK